MYKSSNIDWLTKWFNDHELDQAIKIFSIEYTYYTIWYSHIQSMKKVENN